MPLPAAHEARRADPQRLPMRDRQRGPARLEVADAIAKLDAAAGGTRKPSRGAITCGLISTAVMSAVGRCLWQYLASEPPPRPIIRMLAGSGSISTKPIIVRV